MNYSDWTVYVELDLYSGLKLINCALQISPDVVIVAYDSNFIVAEEIDGSGSLADFTVPILLSGKQNGICKINSSWFAVGT